MREGFRKSWVYFKLGFEGWDRIEISLCNVGFLVVTWYVFLFVDIGFCDYFNIIDVNFYC